jgi:hypothetical protein
VSTAVCSSCGAEILWTVTEAGRRMPVDAKPEKRVVLKVNDSDPLTPLSRVTDTFISHFATCPNAQRHRSAPPKATTE